MRLPSLPRLPEAFRPNVPERLRKPLEYLGYFVWFWVLFLALTWLTLPWGRVRDRLVVAAHEAGVALAVERLGPAWVGFKARGLSLGKVPKAESVPRGRRDRGGVEDSLVAAGDAPPPVKPWLILDRAVLRTGLLGLLAAGPATSAAAAADDGGGAVMRALVQALGRVRFEGKGYGGEMELDVTGEDEAGRFRVVADGIDLGKLGIGGSKFSALSEGRGRVGGDLTWHWEDPKKSSGNLDLWLDSLALSDIHAGWLSWSSRVLFSRSEIHFKVNKGRAELRDSSLESDEVQVFAEGHVRLAKDFTRSGLSLRLKIKFRDDLDAIAKASAGTARHRDDDGFWHYQVTGTIANPRWRESPAGARGKTSTRPAMRGGDYAEPGGGDDDDATSSPRPSGNSEAISRKPMSDEDRAAQDEQRERLREERLQRREERKKKREELMRLRNERQEAVSGGGAREGLQDRVPEIVPEDEQDEVPRDNFGGVRERALGREPEPPQDEELLPDDRYDDRRGAGDEGGDGGEDGGDGGGTGEEE
jgi:type II secretion system protein N